MKIGFIGLGSMGFPMAANLLEAGHELHVYNRTLSKADPLKEKGAIVEKDPGELAASVDVIITMLSDDSAVYDIAEGGMFECMKEKATHISMSTASVSFIRELHRRHEDRNQHLISAPVFGRPDMAEAAKLWIVTAGQSDVIDNVKPVLESLGRAVSVVGERPEQANTIKIAGNFMIASMIETLGESFSLIEKSGMDSHMFLNIMTSALFDAPVYKGYGSMIADRKYLPGGFKMKHGFKDVRLALQIGDEQEVPMPLASLIHDHYLQGVAKGMSDHDWSALAEISRFSAGIGKDS